MNISPAKSFDLAMERHQMVEKQIARRGLREPRLLAAFEKVPRHLFVPQELGYAAYDDCPLPIGFGQTISQPYIVALMVDLLELDGDERVLEVGTGSGYLTMILALLAKEVYTLELIPELAARAAKLLVDVGARGVQARVGDGSMGLAEAGPFDGIIVSAGAPSVPAPLLEQLAPGGLLVLPVGGRGTQLLEVWKQQGQDYHRRVATSVAFVPLMGSLGWRGSEK